MTHPDLHPETGHRANREAALAELERAELDRSALEAIRVSELGLADRASAELLARVAAVLDAGQREKLLELSAFAHHR